jgi:hypothetical protein
MKKILLILLIQVILVKSSPLDSKTFHQNQIK